MKVKPSLAVLTMTGLLVACGTRNPHPMDMTRAVQEADTRSEHEALAEHYEGEAKEMEAKEDEHKKLLAQYQAKGYLYGKQIYRLEEHCQGLIRADEQAVQANLKLAELHRRMAAELK